MDLLQQYGPHDESSSSEGESSPKPKLTQEQRPVGPRKIVTGVIEPVAMTEADFYAAERKFQGRAAKTGPNPSSAWKKAPKTSSPQKRPRTPPPAPSSKRPAASSAPPAPFVPSSTAHPAAARDYQGRSWALPPASSRTFEELETYTPYLPKRCVSTLPRAHDGGVAAVRFSPRHGHLLLSAGMDGKARIWRTDTAECARDYLGHSKAIRDTCFDATGRRFLTAGFDKTVKLWDTETGRVLGSFKTGGMPFCIRFTPGEGEQNEFLVGCGDKKILQMDVRDATSVVQEYDQHMGGVNSISFVEDNRRFVSSADDKVLRVWDYGIPVVIKYVSDPTMHSMPVTALHPNRKWLACQSMDNNVLVFSARDRFKQNSKKRFKGHLVAGYACGLTFSADGRFLGSADSLGRLFFWDWKSARMFRTVQAHKGVCIGLEWHPCKPSLVASCGWDGDVKLWD